MVFDAAGELSLIAGSPGGNSIIAYVAKVLVGVLRGSQSAQAAVDAPNVIARGALVRVETGVGDGAARSDYLQSRGYRVQERAGENSGLHVIHVTPAGLDGAADPRRGRMNGRMLSSGRPRRRGGRGSRSGSRPAR